MRGQISKYLVSKHYGFIQIDQKRDTIFFHSKDVVGARKGMRPGTRVEFDIGTDTNGREKALNVKVLEIFSGEEPYSGETLALEDSKINTTLSEMQDWKLEAKMENLERYFFRIPELNFILEGKCAYIIGRKGTGKTALARYMTKQESDFLKVQILSFKNFPFNKLYEHENDDFTRPNQYITLWKFIIYSFVCRLLAKDKKTDVMITKEINKAFPPVNSDALGSIIGKSILGDFSISAAGNGFSFANWGKKKAEPTLAEKVDNLEAFLLRNLLPNKQYLVLFDELDEDYKDVQATYKKSKYIDLLTSLFKAVQDIFGVFKEHRIDLLPVVLLRDDIYDQIQDPDKNKWSDFSKEINWEESEIKNLLLHRLNRAINCEEAEFDKVWYSLFSPHPIPVGASGKEIKSYEFIKRATQGRPRDFIQYLRECAKLQLDQGGGLIEPDTVKGADRSYSNYLRRELIDEIHGVLPDIVEIFSLLSSMRKTVFRADDFFKVHKERLKRKQIHTENPELILRVLFYFSAIGNSPRPNIQIFKHTHQNANLSLNEPIIIHRGLIKALQNF